MPLPRDYANNKFVSSKALDSKRVLPVFSKAYCLFISPIQRPRRPIARGFYRLNAEKWMILEEVEKIAEVIETCQEVDIDRDAAILMWNSFRQHSQNSSGILIVRMERSKSNIRDKKTDQWGSNASSAHGCFLCTYSPACQASHAESYCIAAMQIIAFLQRGCWLRARSASFFPRRIVWLYSPIQSP